MSRIAGVFEQLKKAQKKALIPYITAGDPSPKYTVSYLHALVEAGADILELGVPFSDPMADGPVIQLACERALEHGTSLTDVLAMVADFRKTDSTTPIVLMGYCNPIEAMGYKVFAERAGQVGVDGVLIVDLPPEEATDFKPDCEKNGLDLIFLLAPTSTDARIEKVAQACSGYLYYVSLKGVTGSATLNVAEVEARLETIRKLTDLPIGVGFGIKDAESASSVSRVADGVVVGSVLVNVLAESVAEPRAAIPRLKRIIDDMRVAMDKV